MCIIYSKLSLHEKNEVNQSSSFCCITLTRMLFQTEALKHGQMMSNAIVADWMLAADATNKPIFWLLILYYTFIWQHDLNRVYDHIMIPVVRFVTMIYLLHRVAVNPIYWSPLYLAEAKCNSVDNLFVLYKYRNYKNWWPFIVIKK